MPTLLGQLTALPLAEPCDEAWDEMRGDTRVRRCAACARDVFDVSAMSALEAELRLLNAGDAVPCIRYRRDAAGAIVHAPRAPLLVPRAPRSLVAATALGVTLAAAAPAHAGDPATPPQDAPAECVAYAAAFAEAPPARAAAKPAPAANAAEPQPVTPAEEPRPVMLAGKPMLPRERPTMGTLSLKSKVPREVVIVGIHLNAPLSQYYLSPGDFAIEVIDPKAPKGKAPRKVRFKIAADKTTVVDLDKR